MAEVEPVFLEDNVLAIYMQTNITYMRAEFVLITENCRVPFSPPGDSLMIEDICTQV